MLCVIKMIKMKTKPYLYVLQDKSDLSIDTDIIKQVAYYCLRENNTQTSCIKRYFNFSYRQTSKIMDELEKMGIIRSIRNHPFIKELSVSSFEEIDAIFNNESSIILTDKVVTQNEVNVDTEPDSRKIWMEQEKQRIKENILKQRELRELRKKAKEELIAEGLIENTKRREPIPQHVQDTVWRRDGGRCVKCGSQENLEFDHIIPLSKGGSNTVRNIQLLCQKCNREKSNKIG